MFENVTYASNPGLLARVTLSVSQAIRITRLNMFKARLNRFLFRCCLFNWFYFYAQEKV